MERKNNSFVRRCLLSWSAGFLVFVMLVILPVAISAKTIYIKRAGVEIKGSTDGNIVKDGDVVYVSGNPVGYISGDSVVTENTIRGKKIYVVYGTWSETGNGKDVSITSGNIISGNIISGNIISGNIISGNTTSGNTTSGNTGSGDKKTEDQPSGKLTESQKKRIIEKKTDYAKTFPDASPSDLCVSADSAGCLSFVFTTMTDAQFYDVTYYKRGGAESAAKTVRYIDNEYVDEGNTAAKKMKFKLSGLSNSGYCFYITAGCFYVNSSDEIEERMCHNSGAVLTAAPVPTAPSKVKMTSCYNTSDGVYLALKITGLNDNKDNVYTTESEILTLKKKNVVSFEGKSQSASVTSKKLKGNSFYFLRTRGVYIDASGKKFAGEWSEYTLFGTGFTGVSGKKTAKGIKIAYPKYKGADRYVIYISGNKDTGFKKCGKTTKRKFTIKNKELKGYTGEYYIKVCAVRKDADYGKSKVYSNVLRMRR